MGHNIPVSDMDRWNHGILELYCTFSFLRRSGAKPERWYTMVKEGKEYKFVPSKEKRVYPPLRERIPDERALCKRPGTPSAEKCLRGAKRGTEVCPFLGWCPVDRGEYRAMMLGWEVYAELKDKGKKMSPENFMEQLGKTIKKWKVGAKR